MITTPNHDKKSDFRESLLIIIRISQEHER